jgi:hypothetical protein
MAEINDELLTGNGTRYDGGMVELMAEQLGNGGFNQLLQDNKEKVMVS